MSTSDYFLVGVLCLFVIVFWIIGREQAWSKISENVKVLEKDEGCSDALERFKSSVRISNFYVIPWSAFELSTERDFLDLATRSLERDISARKAELQRLETNPLGGFCGHAASKSYIAELESKLSILQEKAVEHLREYQVES